MIVVIWGNVKLTIWHGACTIKNYESVIYGFRCKRRHDTQHDDIQHNDTKHNDSQYNDSQHSNKLNETPRIMAFSIMAFSIMAFSIIAFSIMAFSIMAEYCYACWVLLRSMSPGGMSQIIPVCWVSLCWVSLCWVSLCWMSLCRVPWRFCVLACLSKLVSLSKLVFIQANVFIQASESDWQLKRQMLTMKSVNFYLNCEYVMFYRTGPQHLKYWLSFK
jgi:hypothetical protein